MTKRPIGTTRVLSSTARRQKKRRVLARDGAKCALCERALPAVDLILKRKVHLRDGGTSRLDNFHLICHRCNRDGTFHRKQSTS